ncbi:MAG: FecR domain-containing protein [Bacteroidota bacterium]
MNSKPDNHSPKSTKQKRLFGDWFTLGKEASKIETENSWQLVSFRQQATSTYETRELEYAQLQQKLGAQSCKITTPARRDVIVRLQPWARIAAVITLLIGLGVGYWWMQLAPLEEAFVTYAGQTKQLVLPDQSIVHLNENSKISFSPSWQEGQTREVWLEGEAFFAIRKQRHPTGEVKFVVHARDLDVQVLGTQFNVRQQKQSTRVILQSGKVQLNLHQSQSKVLYMKPGELIDYSPGEKMLVQKQVDPALYVAWKDKEVILNGQTIREIAAIIKKTYGIKVVIADSAIANLKLTGKIHSSNVDLILEALVATYPLTYEKKTDQILLNSKLNN